MATATPAKLYTTADLLAMPDDGVERWLVRGQLREQPPEFPEVPVTVRNRHHCAALVSVGYAVKSWLRSQPVPRGQVYGGEIGVRLAADPDSTYGVDLVYAPPGLVAAQDDDETTVLDGVPTLIVEITSPNDTQRRLNQRTRQYLAAGVPLVWVVDPDWRTVTVYRPGERPQSFNDAERLPEYPPMPGFTPAVADLFD